MCFIILNKRFYPVKTYEIIILKIITFNLHISQIHSNNIEFPDSFIYFAIILNKNILISLLHIILDKNPE